MPGSPFSSSGRVWPLAGSLRENSSGRWLSGQCSDGSTVPVSSSRRVPIAPHEAKSASMFRGRLREPDLREECKCAVGTSATNSSGRESCSEDRRAFLRAPAATAFRTARKLDLGHAVQLRALIRTGLSALQNAPLTIPQSGPQRSDTNAATQTQRHRGSERPNWNCLPTEGRPMPTCCTFPQLCRTSLGPHSP